MGCFVYIDNILQMQCISIMRNALYGCASITMLFNKEFLVITCYDYAIMCVMKMCYKHVHIQYDNHQCTSNIVSS